MNMKKIGTTMSPPSEECLIQFLRENKEVFSWNMKDLQWISPIIITYRLNVNPDAKSVKQKKRMFGAERSQAIKEEVEKFLKAKYVRLVQYSKWLANVVLVPKPNGKLCLCIYFTDLNKACQKVPFHLPWINILVDSTSECEMLSFLDAYQGYNQIPLAPKDQEKASFVIDQGVFCYNVMPFGLKNAGATYQWLVYHMFRDQIGRNMEVYIDDMLVKSIKEQDHVKDLQECFQILKTFGLKLNPTKCTFGIRGGKFLSYMISERGIEFPRERLLPSDNYGDVIFLLEHLDMRPRDSGLHVVTALNRDELVVSTVKYCDVAFETGLEFLNVKDLQECFQILKTFGLKLNPAKCTFVIRGGKFLGCMISERGIEANIKLIYLKVYGQGPPILQEFPTSNNEAEYEAFIAGGLAQVVGARKIIIYSDSQLEVNQIQGSYETRGEKMAKYFLKAKDILDKFEESSLIQVSRADNAVADQLAKLASSMAGIRSRRITFLSSDRAAVEQ
ncbi:UNVERIFIED_CONTAM: Transposon Tf2-12 polyprotein [Sesamum calycinum]|uniref:Transposon Tf2-12 polyprotein n=1 Tax=Sesamum calycinum TaxID=2727403 RepID=A0AAW2Q2R4_9LAMI